MIIGNCTYSVRNYLREGEMDLMDFPAFNADLDIKALEYNDMFFESWDDDYLAAIKKSAEDAGCYIQCLTCGGNFASDDDAVREESVATIRQRLHNAAALGAPVIRANIGATGDEERDATVGVERVIEGFNELLPTARELDIKITIENHGGVSKWANPILKVVLGTDPEYIGTCPDFGNFQPMEFRYIELAKVIPFAHLRPTSSRPKARTPSTRWSACCNWSRRPGMSRCCPSSSRGPRIRRSAWSRRGT